MTLRFIDSVEASRRGIDYLANELGNFLPDDTLAVTAAAARLVAARLGPSSRSRLVQATRLATEGLIGDVPVSAQNIDDVVDELLSSGDLLEGRSQGKSQIFLSPPMFVRRASGAAFVIGGLAEVGLPALPGLKSRGTLREIPPSLADEDLLTMGLASLPADVWIASPSAIGPSSLLETLENTLDRAPYAAESVNLEIFDPARPPRFYRGRIVPPGRLTGRYIGRRQRQWGGWVWAYCELSRGRATRVTDLPIVDTRFSSRDEAWWAMHAIDAVRLDRQSAAVTSANGEAKLSLMAPIPRWAERRLLAVGGRSDAREAGALATYTIPERELEEETVFLQLMLWLDISVGRRGQ